ncbi:DUF2125 domain-containing protein [Actibacterium pelagium]|uniref:DUF2125 domain-containing protein n=1 Tax=Actibacterium pelagium TaxID=2029103 RepID=A0A917AKS9_9RHOB|nr:DUF2125 domain-containing protein [Actibacterium pelagium]GGE59370.1 hypothetical protein GCM10011517_28820 [Actibacterium pelagium]
MRALISLTTIAAVLYSGYWFVGSQGVKEGMTTWLDDRRDEGWVADYDDIRVVGFPNRFDATLTQLNLADPDTGLAWSAPFFQLFALSYKPNHLIATWPEQHSISTPNQKITLRSDKSQASLVLQPDTNLALDRMTMVLDGFVMRSDMGWQVRLPAATVATETREGRENWHRIGLSSENALLSSELLAMLGAQGLPETFQTLKLDADVGFTDPWDINALQNRRPQPTGIDLRLLKATWGELDLQAAGELKIDEAGFATGEIEVRATNWKQMVELAVSTGAVAKEVGDGMIQGLSLLAGLGRDPDTLEVPLTFRRGRINLGPIPLGPAPMFVIR